MTRKFFSIPAAVLATTLAATPALAQREHRGEQGRYPQGEQRRGESDNRERNGAQRAQPRAESPRQEAPRQEAPRQEAPRQNPATAPRVVPRGEQPRAEAPRVAPRGDRGSYAVPRVNPRVERPTIVVPRYESRYYGARRWDGWRGPVWYGYRGYSPFRPYFFRPWYRLGFSIHVGYPVAYYAYPYPVPVYGYGAPYSSVYVGPTNTAYGGVALDIQPDDAYVYVDGGYAGIVRDFDGTRQPLTLTPGTHHIEVVQNGFEPLAFDVTVQPGMVIPYQGALRPY